MTTTTTRDINHAALAGGTPQHLAAIAAELADQFLERSAVIRALIVAVPKGQWTSRPGGSSKPPTTLATFIGVIAATDIAGDGGSGAGNGPDTTPQPGHVELPAGHRGPGGGRAAIQGNIAEVVVLDVTDPAAYRPDPGHRASGVLVAIVH